jgi:NAD(P)-dependent dehydrogenase (short-subunit alcohol dehydrogenase family)
MSELESSTPQAPGEMFDLTGRVAIVTGASSGLGERFARVLHTAGAHVVAVARRAERLEELATSHERVVPLAADVTDEAAMEQLVATTMERFGRIDVLVNNAGTGKPAPAVTEPLHTFRASIELNLVSVFNLARLVAVPMLAAGSGSVINIASIYGLGSSWPIPNNGYTAAKGGVVQLTRELACQWASQGVRVNAIAPGFFLTESTHGIDTDEASQRYVRGGTPMRRIGHPHELDGAVLFLASDASTFVTGQTVAVDGGWTAH